MIIPLENCDLPSR